ncbi:uncharacterized protein JN550_011704 [Neoarthrinium moseri]|uniref:uncharacterized protein n=1 Tax=Neoarthrinium moseri TaxID=1658444 RepID=UPI001FDADB0C|nr:uncharacterized protein JN550_011704 [Neoarthrinium moseri]KAI1860020.1 hypothetical protein JN550_011704 [Neoarthrinium moseri]
MAPVKQRTEPPYPLHPSVIDRINPEYAAFYNEHLQDKQQVHLQPVEASRAGGGKIVLGAGKPEANVSVKDHLVLQDPRLCRNPGLMTGQDFPRIPIRIFTPMSQAPAAGWPLCFWFHGGGWVLGNIDTENVITSRLSHAGKCVVITVDYRLAPEHRFPTALEDCWQVFLWATNDSNRDPVLRGINKKCVAVGGSSAGGNIAAAICQRQAGFSTWMPRLQFLSVPVLDNTATAENNVSWRENEFTPALPAAKMMWYREHYLPDPAQWCHPEASPLLWKGNWGKLPPAVILVGELDVLRSEGQDFAKKMNAAGAKANVHVFKGQPHPFIAMDGALSDGRRAIEIFADALSNILYQPE